MNSFPSVVYLASIEDSVGVCVTYEMRDMGVMMRANERVEPVLLTVESYDSANLLPELDEDTMERLRHEAQMVEDHSAEIALDRDNEA